MWTVSQRVLAYWPGDGYWYVGSVQRVSADGIEILFDNFNQSLKVPSELVLPMDIQVGSRVFVRSAGRSEYLLGTVSLMAGEKLGVQLDEGGQETTSLGHIRVTRSQIPVPWRAGDRVLANWPPEIFFYPAVIRAVDDLFVQVDFDDGDRAEIRVDAIRPLNLKKNDRLQVRLSEERLYVPAILKRDRRPELLVELPTGKKEWISIAAIRMLSWDIDRYLPSHKS